MVCLNLSNGFFVPQNWSTAPNFNAGTVTITRNATQITVQRAGLGGSVSMFGDFLYAVFGDLNFVALLHRDAAATGITWTVSMVDITGPSISSTLLFSVLLPSTNSPPAVAGSPGNGRLALLWSGTGMANQARNMMIVRSDNGAVVLPGPGTISGLNSNIVAEITATQLIIHHPNTGSLDTTTGPRPAGSLSVIPASQDFGEAVLGGANPALATITRTFTLRNAGADCLTINAVQNDSPYSVVPGSVALPAELDVGKELMVEVRFSPSTTGNNITGSLPVTRTPTNGASSLECSGDARNAEARISLSRSAIAFGSIPHPGTASQSLAITNTGEKDVLITIPSPPAMSSFQWTPVGTFNLPVGGSSVTVTVTFTTPGDFSATTTTLTITPSEGSARSVVLSGGGCVANAVMGIPPVAPIEFGEVEQGFRTVRFIEITNTGDGELTFAARIVPGADSAHAALFGLILPGNDITDVLDTRPYTVLPPTRCGPGPTGTDPAIVAVSFFADAAASATPYAAQLEVDNPTTGTTTTFPLSARITPAIPVDAVLVLDKSGSMADPIGARNKMEAAIAGGQLFVQMLRDSADDRAALVTYDENPQDVHPIAPVIGNRAALLGALGVLAPGGATNIAGGLILGEDEFTDPLHPSNPPGLKKAIVVLTDGMENRCFQKGGAGPWYSVTGRDAPQMRRPDGTPQDTEVLPLPIGIKVYGIGIGNPAQIDEPALNDLSSATDGYYDSVVDLSGRDFFLLEKYFTQIFMDAAGLAMITDPFYTIAPSEQHEHEFDIFPGDVNTMVVVYDEPGRRLPFHLVTPRGEELSGTLLPSGFGVRHQSTDTARVVEVRFPRGEPKRYAGRWKVVVDHRGYVCAGDINLPDQQREREDVEEGEARERYAEIGIPGFVPEKCREFDRPVDYGIAIGAGSNLRMQPYVEPGTKYTGDPLRLNVLLAEAGLPVTAATVRVRVESPSGMLYTVTLRDDGLSQDGDVDDGDYGGQFIQTSLAGVYKLNFRAEGLQAGRPYVREAHRTKVVYDRRREDGNGMDDCCRKLLATLEALLEERAAS